MFQINVLTKNYVESAAFRDIVKPVVVAVIDTGIYEAHSELRHKIIAPRSKCFVQGKLSRMYFHQRTMSDNKLISPYLDE